MSNSPLLRWRTHHHITPEMRESLDVPLPSNHTWPDADPPLPKGCPSCSSSLPWTGGCPCLLLPQRDHQAQTRTTISPRKSHWPFQLFWSQAQAQISKAMLPSVMCSASCSRVTVCAEPASPIAAGGLNYPQPNGRGQSEQASWAPSLPNEL